MLQVSPSMPTHADPEPSVVGEGTVNVPLTVVIPVETVYVKIESTHGQRGTYSG